MSMLMRPIVGSDLAEWKEHLRRVDPSNERAQRSRADPRRSRGGIEPTCASSRPIDSRSGVSESPAIWFASSGRPGLMSTDPWLDS